MACKLRGMGFGYCVRAANGHLGRRICRLHYPKRRKRAATGQNAPGSGRSPTNGDRQEFANG
jgi:hypothetical protein